MDRERDRNRDGEDKLDTGSDIERVTEREIKREGDIGLGRHL